MNRTQPLDDVNTQPLEHLEDRGRSVSEMRQNKDLNLITLLIKTLLITCLMGKSKGRGVWKPGYGEVISDKLLTCLTI